MWGGVPGLAWANPEGAAVVQSAGGAIARQVELAVRGDILEVRLRLEGSEQPQYIGLNRGRTWVGEMANVRLGLPQARSFHRENPAPGIATLALLPSGDGGLQAIAVGQDRPLVGTMRWEPQREGGNVLVLQIRAESSPSSRSDVAVPAPNPASGPPVGPQTVANLPVRSFQVNLGTDERVSSLVLRSAPVRDVLALLAMTAGLNAIFLEVEAPPAAERGAPAAATPSTISMEIRDDRVENVFNYVLQVAGLQARRDGKTVLIGRNLPITARETILRTIRLNQLKVNLPNTEITMTANIDASLASGGTGGGTANSRIARTQSLSQRFPLKGALQLLEELGANGGTQAQANRPGAARGVGEGDLLLGGLQAAADTRTNTLTLIGPPHLVDLAETYLRQLDVRKRQVAVNVRIVEVALDKTENTGTSFSFGVDDSFFSVNQGEATANFGTVNPRFLPRPSDPNPNPGSLFSPDILQNPLNSGGLDGITRPFSFPTRFLLNLQARLLEDKAKILTDPTLIVQEGSASQVNLTTQVFAGFRTINQPGPGNTVTTVSDTRDPIDVGVILNIAVDAIDDNGFVTLAVSPEVSSPGQSITDPSRNNLLIQQLVNRRRLDTGFLRLRAGQTLVLAGIINESERTVTRKTPILGDIPLLGSLFRSTEDQRDRSEVIVLVTPRLLD
ncbi:MAG: type II secretion system protein GspD [Pseudanabaenaceae cyanobacterium]